jgi:hypothetical protein
VARRGYAVWAVLALAILAAAVGTQVRPASAGTVHNSLWVWRPSPAIRPSVTTEPAVKPFFGLAVPQADLATVPGLATAVGEHPTVFSLFVKLDSPLTVAKFTNVVKAGMTPFVTLEPWSYKSQGAVQPNYTLKSIYSGAHDAELTHIAGLLAQVRAPVYLRFGHEMNAWWYPWAESVNGNRPGDYVKAWTHVHQVMLAAGATNLRWVWSPNIAVGTRTTPLAGLMPPASTFDYAGISCYAHSGTAASTCGATLTQLEALTGKPLLLSEIGADGTSKASWIASLAPLLKAHPRLAGFVWFNTTPQTTGASGYYRFDDTPADLAAFRAMLRGR